MEKNKNNIKSEETPLNAYLSQAGLCSRRMAVEFIKEGDVFVNNEMVTEPGYKVKPRDIVKYKDKIIRPEKKIYILLNKPKGYVTTVDDEMNRKIVMDLIKPVHRERLYPVGRLDRDTTGLLIITNDGYLSQKLAHPKNKIAKKYSVVLNRPVEYEDLERLKKGIFLEDGRAKADKINYVRVKTQVMIEIHGGKNRIIKRMFAALGYRVTALDRVSFAHLTKKNLSVGKWRYLTESEVKELQALGK